MKDPAIREIQSVEYVYARSLKIGLDAALQEIERGVILATIKKNGRFDRAADEIGVKRTTFVMKRKRLGLL